MTIASLWRVMAVVAFCAAAAAPARGAAQPAARLLDVPYLPQTVALCGGAAAAMVMRYWGASGVHPESFAELVDLEAGGIRGDRLAADLARRGWQALSFRGDAALVQSHLSRGRPVIALIEDRPGQYHYVVVVGWHGDRVVAHDPAQSPFRVYDEDGFRQAWARSGFWTLLALPAAAERAEEDESRAAERRPDPVSRTDVREHRTARRDVAVGGSGGAASDPACAGMLDEAVRLAGVEARDEAARLLDVAVGACSESGAPWRERAGLRALNGDWAAAAEDARAAVARDPADAHAWRILATSLYLEGDPLGALGAWNQLGEPRVDVVEVSGAIRNRYTVLHRAVGLDPGTLLTPPRLEHAHRRVFDIPSVAASQITYRPATAGLARIEAAVLEHPAAPVGPIDLAATAVRAATDRELSVSLAGLSGGGERLTMRWRWWEHRPRTGVEVSLPLAPGGVLSVSGEAETQTYGPADDRIVETSRRVGARWGDWLNGRTRWDARGALERWSDVGNVVAAGIGLERHVLPDRLVLEGSAGARGGALRIWNVEAAAAWRSDRRVERAAWTGRAGLSHASGSAPLALWPGAGTGPGRDVLLRAHPLLRGGVIDDGIFGRTLLHGGVEWRHWFRPGRPPVWLAPAVFVDAARAARGGTMSDLRAHVDVGAGWRVRMPGADVLRIDVARGLRDGRIAVSAGWLRN